MNCNILRKVTLSTRMMSTVSKRLEGKVAIVTASTAGIGYAIAEGLPENGAKVVISSRKETNVEEAQLRPKGLEVSGCVCHVGKTEDRAKLLELTLKQYGKLDILVNNAGISPAFGPLLKTTSEQCDKNCTHNEDDSCQNCNDCYASWFRYRSIVFLTYFLF
uniref:Uncharacterized protein n=1 Tax=Clytia hemisphaerica TaxID=252671 RepID=A0A7M5U384_9CNID